MNTAKRLTVDWADGSEPLDVQAGPLVEQTLGWQMDRQPAETVLYIAYGKELMLIPMSAVKAFKIVNP